MVVLRFKIKKRIDLESLSDAMAGIPAKIVVNELAEIVFEFDDELDDELYLHITEVMEQFGAARA